MPREAIRRRLYHAARQQTLIRTHPSVVGGSCLDEPRLVFVGIGLCGRHGLSVGPPLDVLGLLLTAHRAARLVHAPLLILVADAHAEDAGARSLRVQARTAEWRGVLDRFARLSPGVRVVVQRAHALHAEAGHAAARADAAALCPPDASDYCRLQVADLLHLQRTRGPLLKVGWSLADHVAWGRFDEMAFDWPLRRRAHPGLGFWYTRPGRTFDPRRPRAIPYVAASETARVLLRDHVDPAAQLAAHRHAPPLVLAGVRRHLKAIARLWSEEIAPLQGPLEARLPALYDQFFARAAGHADASAPRPGAMQR